MPRQKREKNATGIYHVMQGQESKTCPSDSMKQNPKEFDMKQTVLIMMLAASMSLVSCGNGATIEPYPFKTVSELYSEYNEVRSTDQNGELYKEFTEKRKAYCEQLNGKSIHATIEDSLGYELASPIGTFENCGLSGMSYEKTEFTITFDLKVNDAEVAAQKYGFRLMAAFYDDEDRLLYASSVGTQDYFDEEKKKTTFNVGDAVRMETTFRIKFKGAPYFSDVSKVIIKEKDDQLLFDFNQQYGA